MSSLVQNETDFLTFLKSRFHIYHCSNVFFRDFQYGIMAYAEEKGAHVSYGNAEEQARELIAQLTAAGILKEVKPGSWMLNYESFRKPPSKPEAAPKVNVPAVPAKSAATATT
jgi:hypothetical protein